MDELLTVKQVAQLLQLHEITIRRYIKSGRLEAVRIGRNVRVPRRAVKALLQEQNATLREAPPVYRVNADEEPGSELPSEIIDRIQHLRREVEQFKRDQRNRTDEALWDDLEQALDSILREAIVTGTAIEGEWQGD